MFIMKIPLRKHFMPFGNVLPYEIQEKILDERNKILEKERNNVIKSLSIIELMNELDRKIEKYAPEQQIGDCGYTAKGSYKLYSVIGYDIHNIVEALSLGINVQRNTINGNPPLVEYWDGLEEQEQYVIAGECFDSFDITNNVLQGDDDDFSRLSMYCIDWITTNKGFAGNP